MLCGTGQGNSISRALYRDISYLICKHVENAKMGIKVKLLLLQDYLERMIIAFVEDTNFYSSRINSEDEIQKIMKIHAELH